MCVIIMEMFSFYTNPLASLLLCISPIKLFKSCIVPFHSMNSAIIYFIILTPVFLMFHPLLPYTLHFQLNESIAMEHCIFVRAWINREHIKEINNMRMDVNVKRLLCIPPDCILRQPTYMRGSMKLFMEKITSFVRLIIIIIITILLDQIVLV